MEQEDVLDQYNFYKQLILNNKTNGRNVIIETKNGEQGIPPLKLERWKIVFPIEDIERITFFIDGKEYEFVACQ